jgi:alkanesulfonate monooxygenase SsuD/methylene tetrahydromethanopterin reductase-like flavin-dependent oxidoreductase (luciferase family)
MTASIVAYRSGEEINAAERDIATVSKHAWPPAAKLLDAEAIALQIARFDAYDVTVRLVKEFYESAGRSMPPVLLKVNVCIGKTAHQALQRFDEVISRLSRTHLEQLWFVGTEEGLAGLIQDLSALRLGDGIVAIPIDEHAPESPPHSSPLE